jgi:hypothetical protein
MEVKKVVLVRSRRLVTKQNQGRDGYRNFAWDEKKGIIFIFTTANQKTFGGISPFQMFCKIQRMGIFIHASLSSALRLSA